MERPFWGFQNLRAFITFRRPASYPLCRVLFGFLVFHGASSIIYLAGCQVTNKTVIPIFLASYKHKAWKKCFECFFRPPNAHYCNPQVNIIIGIIISRTICSPSSCLQQNTGGTNSFGKRGGCTYIPLQNKISLMPRLSGRGDHSVCILVAIISVAASSSDSFVCFPPAVALSIGGS